MTAKEAITLFKYYLQSNHKRRTVESYTLLPDRFNAIHAGRVLGDITADEIFHFLEDMTRSMAKSPRRLRYAQLKAFYNFIIDRCSLNMRNPCNASLLSKSFKRTETSPAQDPGTGNRGRNDLQHNKAAGSVDIGTAGTLWVEDW
jgi:integrase